MLRHKKVLRLQSRIYKAKTNNNNSLVQWLQKRLINSIDVKRLAVQRVTTLNQGMRHTAGVDGLSDLNPKQKTNMIRGLRLNGKASPIRRVWIPKKKGKAEKRPLGIPTIQDRAKQALAKLALEPEWEELSPTPTDSDRDIAKLP
jgi:RNA-directed DNA polymerase